MKPNTFLRGPRTKPLQSPLIEASKFLASQARRYAQGKATVGDVEVAVTEWRGALHDERYKSGGKRIPAL